jgi:hypothetical protein
MFLDSPFVIILSFLIGHHIAEMLNAAWLSELRNKDVGFEVLRAVVVKSTIFWDILVMPCSLLKVNQRYGGTSPSCSGSNKPSKIPA